MTTLIQQGSFVSTGANKIIPLPGEANYFRAVNITQAATTQAVGRGVEFEWFKDITPPDGAVEYSKTDSVNAIEMSTITSGGFTYINTVPPLGQVLTGTTITQASQAVASVANSYSNGDAVRIWNAVGMQQISTMVFSITSATTSNFVLPGLNTSGFAAGATAFTVQRIPQFQGVLPQYLFITAISQATQAVVGVSTVHGYAVGMKVKFDVPSIYGMSQITNLEGTILAVTTYGFTVDIDTTGFTAFAFPASAASLTATRFATISPAGQRAFYDSDSNTQYGYNFTQAPTRSVYQVPAMSLAAGVDGPAGSSGDVIVWQAFRSE